MRSYLASNVFDASLARLEYIFDEFQNVVVGFSGGKDSTITLNLALEVAREKNRLPLTVMFLDQEAEWQTVVDYVRKTFKNPEIEAHWLQVPIKLFNAASMNQPWLYCWEKGKEAEWMREQEPDSIKDKDYGTDRFHKFFGAYMKTHFGDESCALLGGVRAEESPARRTALTQNITYKHITYGKTYDKKRDHYTFYPFYDWALSDVWAAIEKNNWDYCPIYDYYYQHGLPAHKMRVSNLHHETAVDQLFYLQEIEGDTWNKLTARLEGISQARHFKKTEMYRVDELPFMFRSWREYRNHLLAKLVSDDKREVFTKKFNKMEEDYEGMSNEWEMYKTHIMCILRNDYEFTTLGNFQARPESINFHKWKKGLTIEWNRPERDLRFIPYQKRQIGG